MCKSIAKCQHIFANYIKTTKNSRYLAHIKNEVVPMEGLQKQCGNDHFCYYYEKHEKFQHGYLLSLTQISLKVSQIQFNFHVQAKFDKDNIKMACS